MTATMRGLKTDLTIAWYRFLHWVFKWKQDEEGDLAFVICNCVTFVKYKEHTRIRFDGHKLQDAGKWQGHNDETREAYHEKLRKEGKT